LFSGYDSQALALKYLGVDFEHYKTCEWAVKSIQALKDLHFGEDKKDYSKDIKIEQIKKFLLNKGVSSNYNDPMSKNQIDRLNEKQARTIYNNIKATHNLVNIQQVKGKDLEITDTDKYTYIMTYSFPCQDLSLAGNRKGMSDTSTRSGMLWEVERLLGELEEKPQVLLMENVPQVHGEGAKEDFNKWQLRLEELGYKNYWKDLIATDYGIPQTRNRCFMISILGDYNYTFPKPIPLKLKLKNMLENNVDEKYYLSDKMMEYITSKDDKYKVNENNLNINRSIACSKTTREGNTRADTTDYICEELPENFNIKNGCKQIYDLNYYNHEQSNRVYSVNYSSPTLRTKSDEAGTIKIKCSNKSLQETLEQNEIDDTCYIDTYNKRIDKDKSGTITTGVSFRNITFLAIKNATQKGYLEATDGDGIDLAQPNSETRRGRVQKNAIQTLTTQNNLGVCVGTYQYAKSDKFMQGKERLQLGKQVSDTLQTTQKEGIVNNDLKIRKLTPKECFRLMGVKDEDFEKVAKNQSDSSLYHLAGDSIVVNVLMAIFKEMI
jgi:DNA (cytosine-5)-methyltransferase 1